MKGNNKKMYGIVYKVTCLINNKVYIGQTTQSLEERKCCHYSHMKNENVSSNFLKALRKYDNINFKWEIIDYANNKQELDDKEQNYIRKYKGNSYNQVKRLTTKEVSIIKYLCNIEKLKISEIIRLMNLSTYKSVHNIVHNITFSDVFIAKQIPYTREEIEKVKQESIEIQNIKNSNKPPHTVESKIKRSTTSDETISYILWFLENTDMTSPELKELFNYSAMSKLRNGKTRTWVKPAKIVPIDVLQKASQLREKRKFLILENKVKDIKYIMNNKLMNQSQCARKFNVSQAFIWKVINNQTFDYVLPNDCYDGLIIV